MQFCTLVALLSCPATELVIIVVLLAPLFLYIRWSHVINPISVDALLRGARSSIATSCTVTSVVLHVTNAARSNHHEGC